MMKSRRSWGTVALLLGWAACAPGASSAPNPAGASDGTPRESAAPTGGSSTGGSSNRDSSAVSLTASTGEAATAGTTGTTGTAGTPTTCTAPVACAGTMSGTWCVDTFFPTETSSPEFGGVWSSGPDDVWAVGWRNTAQQGDVSGFAFHWDGCAWSQSPITTAAGLNDVWGASATDVWIVGAQGATFHWSGAGWTPVATGATGTFNHVSGSSSTDVWAIGNAGLWHWNGSAWTADPGLSVNAQDGFLGDIWAVAPNDVWVAEGFNARGSVAHFDGAGWAVSQPSPEVDFGLFGIWSSGATTWAVGEGNQVMQNSGGSWTQFQPPGGSAQGWVNAMGSGADVWVAGQTVALSTGGGAFQKITDVPPGFYQGLWLNGSQVWIAGINNAGTAVVMHRPR